MLESKIIGLLLVLTALAFSFADWLRDYLNNRQKRRNRRFARKCRNTYKRRFAIGQSEVNDWREEHKEKKQNIICKNPAYAEAWQ